MSQVFPGHKDHISPLANQTWLHVSSGQVHTTSESFAGAVDKCMHKHALNSSRSCQNSVVLTDTVHTARRRKWSDAPSRKARLYDRLFGKFLCKADLDSFRPRSSREGERSQWRITARYRQPAPLSFSRATGQDGQSWPLRMGAIAE